MCNGVDDKDKPEIEGCLARGHTMRNGVAGRTIDKNMGILSQE
jgi:hypothetical protein